MLNTQLRNTQGHPVYDIVMEIRAKEQKIYFFPKSGVKYHSALI